MIKKIALTSLSIIMFQVAFAQGTFENKENTNSPTIVFNKRVHNFGKIVQDDPAGCEFKFYNKGKSPLILSDVTASCGCTVPSWSRRPVMPGDSGIIQVLFLADSPGNFDKVITVFSNATKIPSSLKLNGKVIRK